MWASLTERGRLAEWLGEVDLEPWPGGAIRIVFTVVDPPAVLESVVQEIDLPRLLQFRFDDGEGDGNIVRFELTARGETTLLVLTQFRVPSDQELADNAAGWHMRPGGTCASTCWKRPWTTVRRISRGMRSGGSTFTTPPKLPRCRPQRPSQTGVRTHSWTFTDTVRPLVKNRLRYSGVELVSRAAWLDGGNSNEVPR